MSNYKFGTSFNTFSDSSELLEHAIRCIRDHVDHISVVYQLQSNTGAQATEPLEDLMSDLLSKKLVDEVYCFKPKIGNNLHALELEKRNLGLFMAQNADVTHFATMDSDELYDSVEFGNLVQMYRDGDITSAYCQMLSYYKTSEFILEELETYYIALFYKLEQQSQFHFNAPASVLVDPTRRCLPNENPLILTRDQIQCHHLSYVRKDIRLKLESSSASTNFLQDIPKLVQYYEDFDFDTNPYGYWGGLPSTLHKLKRVEDKFGIKF